MAGTKTDWNLLEDGLDTNDLAKVKAGAGSDMAGTKRYYDACRWEIKHGHADVLDALLTAGGGFDFDSTKNDFAVLLPFRDQNAARIANRELAVKLIDEAYASSDPEATLPVLYKHRNNGKLYDFKPLRTSDFVRENAPVSLLKTCLKTDSNAFGVCLQRVGMASTEKLTFMMPYVTEKDARQISLRLLDLSSRGAAGDYEKIMLLLASPLSAHYSYYKEALVNVAGRKNREILELLLSRAPLEKIGEGLVKELKRNKNADPAINSIVEAAVQSALRDKFRDAAEAKSSVPQTPSAPTKAPADVKPAQPVTPPAPPAAEKTPEKKIYLKKQPPKKIMLRKV